MATKETQMTSEQADKAAFVRAINNALISYGDGRYDFLKETPLSYEVNGFEEFVRCGCNNVCVTGDSLKALMSDLSESNIL